MIAPTAMNMRSFGEAEYAALSIDEVLAPHADIISRIKLCYGADRQSFDAEIVSLIRSYAGYVHLLPATPDNHFSSPGGLLRLGLEAGFFSLQGTDAHIFSGRATITTRRQLEPRWRYATFIAGMCCELHRALSHMVVTTPSGETWSGYLQPLSEWLSAKGIKSYVPKWRPQAQETRSLGLFALPHVISPTVLHYLAEENTVIVPHFLACITGLPLYRDHNVLDQLVRRSLALVIDCNLMANADRMGSPQLGSHIARYLIDILQRLAKSNAAWTCNGDKSRVWFGKDGLFLLWPNAAEDVKKFLEGEQLVGIPKAPELLLKALRAANAIDLQDEVHPTWNILPPGSKAVQEAIKLSSSAILFPDIQSAPEAMEVELIHRPSTNDRPPPLGPTPTPSKPTTRFGEQLPLIPSAPIVGTPVAVIASDKVLAPCPDVSPHPPLESTAPIFDLQAPMRLHPATRDALTTIIQTLNGEASFAQGCLVTHGLFVPLSVLEQNRLQPSLALRTLTEVGMLIPSESAPTHSVEFNGAATIGLVIASRFIAGFPLSELGDTVQGDCGHAA